MVRLYIYTRMCHHILFDAVKKSSQTSYVQIPALLRKQEQTEHACRFPSISREDSEKKNGQAVHEVHDNKRELSNMKPASCA